MSFSLSSYDANTWLEHIRSEKQIKFFEFNKFSEKKVIGNGAFGEVFRAELKEQDRMVALKCLYSKGNTYNEAINKQFIKELQVLIQINHHKNIIRLYGITKDPISEKYMLVLKYADNGTLKEYLQANFTKLDGAEKLNLAKQLAKGLKCIHDEGIIHRDLNHNNILIHNGKIKISDLGYSKLSNDQSNSKTDLGIISYIDPAFLKDMDNFRRNEKSDIFSLGVLFWVISSGYPPTNQYGYIFSTSPEKEKGIHGTPDKYVMLYQRCWDDIPTNRPDIHGVNEQLEEIEWSAETVSNFTSTNTEEASDDSSNQKEQFKTLADDLLILFYKLYDKSILNDGDDRELEKISASLKSYYDKTIQFPSEFKIYLQSLQYKIEYKIFVGFLYHNGVILEQDHSIAYEIYNESALNRDPRARCLLGDIYFNGSGVEKDEKKVFEWFLQSAEGGYSTGQCKLGLCYRLGIGIQKNKKKAFEWFLKSAQGGNSTGQLLLGYCYQTGLGIQKDKKEAFEWYLRSAESGNSTGQNNLGYCYLNGVGIQKDEKKAFEWYLKSAEGENSAGQYSLGYFYQNGIGVQEDKDKAFEWYSKSADGGFAPSKQKLNSDCVVS